MHKPSDPQTVEGVLTPANRRPDIDAVEKHILASLEQMGYPDASRFAVRVAIEEAMVNAFLHGHRGLPAEHPITVQFRIGPSQVWLAVTDQGPGFDPSSVPDPTDESNIELPSGRGLMLIKAFMSTVTHEDNGRRLVMTYDRPAADA